MLKHKIVQRYRCYGVEVKEKMKIKNLYLLLVVILSQGCSPIEKSDRLYYKLIKSSSGEIHWFRYSYITSNSNDFVLVKNEDSIDTLCITSNLYDIRLNNSDSLDLLFFGYPKRYEDSIMIPSKCQNFHVNVIQDSTYAPEDCILKYFNIDSP